MKLTCLSGRPSARHFVVQQCDHFAQRSPAHEPTPTPAEPYQPSPSSACDCSRQQGPADGKGCECAHGASQVVHRDWHPLPLHTFSALFFHFSPFPPTGLASDQRCPANGVVSDCAATSLCTYDKRGGLGSRAISPLRVSESLAQMVTRPRYTSRCRMSLSPYAFPSSSLYPRRSLSHVASPPRLFPNG